MLRELAPTPRDRAALEYCWAFFARPKQLAPAGKWRTWMICAGRGAGKTRSGAEWIRSRVESGKARRVALVGPTAADVRDTMIEGVSGLLAISPPWCRPTYEPSKRRLTWPNGAIATAFSADEPDRLRGPQHDTAWCDELASWRYPEAWDQLLFGLRIGDDPRVVVTTTPQPTAMIRGLISDPTTVVTRGSTFENRANLAQAFLEKIASKYEGTRLGRQELYAEILDDAIGALWKRDDIERCRVRMAPTLRTIVIAVDPAVTDNEDSAETGIVAFGVAPNAHGYVLDDLSARLSPNAWARRAIAAFDRVQANRVVVEVNNGGDLLKATLRTVRPSLPIVPVRASRGKRTRAEPVAALYEQGRIHHVGLFSKLEEQLCTWIPDSGMASPDRLDALVWAATQTMVPTMGVFRRIVPRHIHA